MNSLNSTDKVRFSVVISIVDSSIILDLEFEEKADDKVVMLFNEETRKMEEEYLYRAINPTMKNEIEKRLTTLIGNNNLNCLAAMWK